MFLIFVLCFFINFAFGQQNVENKTAFIDLTQYQELVLGDPDYKITGVLVATDQSSQNPEELGTYFEGDILIPRNLERNGMTAKSSRWPGGIVPYEINGHFTKSELKVIHYAINEYHTKTCVRFQPRKSERDFISIESNATGCWSSAGRMGYRQVVNLQSPSCLRTYGTTIHELMHAIGFFHEQNRYERDSYIKVLKENIQSKMLNNFEKSKPNSEYNYGVPYDYESVMHYSPNSFSKNRKPTIMALNKTKESERMGQRLGFSIGDIRKINAMYKCK